MRNILKHIKHMILRPLKRNYHFGIVYLDADKYDYMDHDQRLEMAVIQTLKEYIAEMEIVGGIEESIDFAKERYVKSKKADSEYAENDKRDLEGLTALHEAHKWFSGDRVVHQKVKNALEEKMTADISIDHTHNGMLVVNTDVVNDGTRKSYQELYDYIKKKDDYHFQNVIKYRSFMWV